MASIGTNYGLNNTLQYYELSLDSGDALLTQSAGVSSLNWPFFTYRFPLENIAAIKVVSAEIPFTYYVITAANGSFTLTETGHSPVTITLPPGNYVSTGMTTELAALLTAASPSGFTYTVSYANSSSANDTYKLTITNNDMAAGTFTLTFGAAGNSGFDNPRLWLGFDAGSISSTAVAGVATLTAPNVVNLTGPNYLYLSSQALGQLVKMYLPDGAEDLLGTDARGPQIARIPVNANPGGIILYDDPSQYYWFDTENLVNLSSLDLYFTMGNLYYPFPVDFNGAQFSVKLGVLINKRVHNDNVQGGGNGVVAISRPRGMPF